MPKPVVPVTSHAPLPDASTPGQPRSGNAARALSAVRNIASEAAHVARDPVGAVRARVDDVLSRQRPVEARLLVRAATTGAVVLDARVHTGKLAEPRPEATPRLAGAMRGPSAVALTFEPANLGRERPSVSGIGRAILASATGKPLRAGMALLPKDLSALHVDADVTVFPKAHQRGVGELPPVCSAMVHAEIRSPGPNRSDGVPLDVAAAIRLPGVEGRVAGRWDDVEEAPLAGSFAASLQKQARHTP